MINLENISSLHRAASGIWISASREPVSFPSNGNLSRADKETESFWYMHRNRCISAAIANFPPSGLILDLGGGNGTVSIFLQNKGYQIIMLDPELTAVKEALNKGVANVICSTFDSAQFNERTIPAIGLFDVLEHIPDDVVFLKRVRRILSSSGMIYLTVPAFMFLWSEADHQAGHYRRYTLESVSDALVTSGFQIKYISYFFSILMLPVLLIRSLPYSLGVHPTDKNWRHKHHKSDKRIFGSWMEKALGFEAELIGRRKCVPFGSSCLIVAQSTDW